jgi:hypothetical protein
MDEGGARHYGNSDDPGRKTTDNLPGSSEFPENTIAEIKKVIERVKEIQAEIKTIPVTEPPDPELLDSFLNYFMEVKGIFVNYREFIKGKEYPLVNRSDAYSASVSQIIQISEALAGLFEEYIKNKEHFSKVAILGLIYNLLPQLNNLLPEDTRSAGR